MRKLIFLINPVAGTKSKEASQKQVIRKTKKAGLPFEILPTQASGNYSFLIEKIHTENITDVIVCGGDGSINQVAAALQGIPVHIGILPMGSGNGLARAAGIATGIGKALDIIYRGKASYIDGFYINRHFSCMLCGLGFDAQVAHDFASQSTRGLATYIEQTIKNFFSVSSYPFIIHINGEKIETPAFFICVANSNQFGNNVTIAPKASIADGLLDVVIVKKDYKLSILYALFKQIIFGKVMPHIQKQNSRQKVHYYQVKELQIENPALAPLHIDGEPAETTNYFEIKIKENAFKLLQP